MSWVTIIWGFVESDLYTFAVPNTAFGILSGFAGPLLVESPISLDVPSTIAIPRRVPLVLAFNLGNLLVFDLPNQRSPQSVAEDRINKPWRPIPPGEITIDETRRLMIVAIPVVVALNYIVGASEKGMFILIHSWIYNDLGSGDEAFVRETIIAIAYGFFNTGSLLVAVGRGQSLSALGLIWTFIVSGIILTTMQIQDLKDQAGDKVRGRKTIALYLGENVSRTSIAFFVCFWSWICGYFWAPGFVALGFTTAIAATIASRVLFFCSPREDALTWIIWCFWRASLYTLPAWTMGGGGV
jgi:4-hydroxybenzoate polyprenyltransferase